MKVDGVSINYKYGCAFKVDIEYIKYREYGMVYYCN